MCVCALVLLVVWAMRHGMCGGAAMCVRCVAVAAVLSRLFFFRLGDPQREMRLGTCGAVSRSRQRCGCADARGGRHHDRTEGVNALCVRGRTNCGGRRQKGQMRAGPVFSTTFQLWPRVRAGEKRTGASTGTAFPGPARCFLVCVMMTPTTAIKRAGTLPDGCQT